MKITDNVLITMQQHREEVIQLYGEDEDTETFQKVIELLTLIKENNQEKINEYVKTIPDFWHWYLNDLVLTYMNAFQSRFSEIEYNLDVIEYLNKKYGRL